MLEDFLQDSIYVIVDAWGLPGEAFSQAVNDQARLMAMTDTGLSGLDNYASPYHPLQF